MQRKVSIRSLSLTGTSSWDDLHNRQALSVRFREMSVIFEIFRKYPVPSALIIFSFLLSTSNRNTYFQATHQYFVVSE